MSSNNLVHNQIIHLFELCENGDVIMLSDYVDNGGRVVGTSLRLKETPDFNTRFLRLFIRRSQEAILKSIKKDASELSTTRVREKENVIK